MGSRWTEGWAARTQEGRDGASTAVWSVSPAVVSGVRQLRVLVQECGGCSVAAPVAPCLQPRRACLGCPSAWLQSCSAQRTLGTAHLCM